MTIKLGEDQLSPPVVYSVNLSYTYTHASLSETANQ